MSPSLAATVISLDNFENIRYEGFGPYKTAVIVEALTDNKNRTASKIRTIFQKNGGGLGTKGSAVHNFQQTGVIKLDKREISDEKIFNLSIDLGVNECFSNKDFHEIHTDVNKIYEIKKKLEENISNFLSTELEWRPLNLIALNNENKNNMIKFLEILDDNDDVQNIFTNVKFEN